LSKLEQMMVRMQKQLLFILIAICAFIPASPQSANYPAPVEGDYKIANYEFESKEVLPSLNLHYAVIGTPHKDKNGQVDNAVLIMHGTTGSRTNFLTPTFGGR